jgi:nucleoside-diphosphate-sugar epimerase
VGAPRVVITGAGGFIGAAVCRAFARAGRDFEGWVRREPAKADARVPVREMGNLASTNDDTLARALDGAAAVIHLAGRAHLAHVRDQSALRRDNVDVTARLARAARRAGVPRFILASTVKVNGEWTHPRRPFRPGDPPAPRGAYARSKRDAERALFDAASAGAMVATALRLPLVYGAGAPGNFAALVAAVRAGRLLPLGAIDNRRHLVGVDNVADALAAALDHSLPVSGVHFVADADSVSTPELVRAIAAALRVRPRLVAVPVPLLRLGGTLLGRGAAIDRLTRSLEVDASSYTAATDWRPHPFHIDPATVEDRRGR